MMAWTTASLPMAKGLLPMLSRTDQVSSTECDRCPYSRSWRSCHSAARVRPKAGIPKISCEPPASIDSSCCWPPWRFIIVAAHKTPSRVHGAW